MKQRSSKPFTGTARYLGILAVFVLASCAPKHQPSLNEEPNRKELLNLTAAHTRLVWLQDAEDHKDLSLKFLRPTYLVGFDSKDGAGDRLLLPSAGRFMKPLVAPNGDRVVFSEYVRGIPRVGSWAPDKKVMYSRSRYVLTRIVNWDGTGLRTIAHGQALEVWIDPETSEEWVYVQAGPHRGEEMKLNPVYRFPIDRSAPGELVWDKTPVDGTGAGSFQISADGDRAVGLLPWADVGVINLENQTWERIGTGCWTSLSPDNTYTPWLFDGAHRHLIIMTETGRMTAKLSLSSTDQMRGAEAYHPRWSNHPDYFVMTGPYRTKEGDGIRGAPEVEIFVGKFNRDQSGIQAWAQATSNRHGDYFPDLWVDRGTDAPPFAKHVQRKDNRPKAKWPDDTGGLIFIWDNAQAKNELSNGTAHSSFQCKLEPSGFAHYGRNYSMRLTGHGAFRSASDTSNMLERLRAGGELTLEATITASSSTPKPAPVVTLEAKNGTTLMMISQHGDHLAFSIQTSFEENSDYRCIDLGSINMGQPVHVAATYLGYGRLRGYIDGVEVADVRDDTGTLKHWKDAHIVIGKTREATSSWSGEVSGLAVYSIALDAARVAHHTTLNIERLGEVAPLPRLNVQATLLEITPTPPPKSIEPYKRCLVTYKYQITDKIAGDMDTKEILVAHWSILDGSETFVEGPVIGNSYLLSLEPFDDHEELLSERIDMSMTDFDLPLYYDIRPPSVLAQKTE